MGYTRDTWFAKVRQPNGATRRVPTKHNGRGKRWQSVWRDDDGREVTRAFATKEAADRNWRTMETDVDRGDYIDPRAGKTPLRAVAELWLDSRNVDPASAIRYESLWRLHVGPEFGRRAVGSIRPSQIEAFLTRLTRQYGRSTAAGAYLVLQGALNYAVADGLLKVSPATARTVTKPRADIGPRLVAWSDDQAEAVIAAHPPELRLIPVLMAAAGLRIGEAAGLSVDDFDFERHVLHVCRQLKRLGSDHVWALPKSDREREVPIGAWAEEATLAYVSQYPPRPLALPWESLAGPMTPVRVLFRWPTDDSFVRYRLYSEQTWKPALAAAGIIPPSELVTDPRNKRKTRRRFATTGREGPHQLRHYYAAVMLQDGVSITALAQYLGHWDPSVTLRAYGHLQSDTDDRARSVIDGRMNRRRRAAGGHLRVVQPGERPDGA